MDGPHEASQTERQKSYDIAYMRNLKKRGTNELIYKTETELQMQKINLQLCRVKEEEIKPVNPKGNQPRIFIGRTDAEAEAPILWPPDVKRP